MKTYMERRLGATRMFHSDLHYSEEEGTALVRAFAGLARTKRRKP
jgi:hypothetical protein